MLKIDGVGVKNDFGAICIDGKKIAAIFCDGDKIWPHQGVQYPSAFGFASTYQGYRVSFDLSQSDTNGYLKEFEKTESSADYIANPTRIHVNQPVAVLNNKNVIVGLNNSSTAFGRNCCARFTGGVKPGLYIDSAQVINNSSRYIVYYPFECPTAALRNRFIILPYKLVGSFTALGNTSIDGGDSMHTLGVADLGNEVHDYQWLEPDKTLFVMRASNQDIIAYSVNDATNPLDNTLNNSVSKLGNASFWDMQIGSSISKFYNSTTGKYRLLLFTGQSIYAHDEGQNIGVWTQVHDLGLSLFDNYGGMDATLNFSNISYNPISNMYVLFVQTDSFVVIYEIALDLSYSSLQMTYGLSSSGHVKGCMVKTDGTIIFADSDSYLNATGASKSGTGFYSCKSGISGYTPQPIRGHFLPHVGYDRRLHYRNAIAHTIN